MVMIKTSWIKKFAIKVCSKEKEAHLEFLKVKKDDKSFWEGKTIQGNMNLDNTFPDHFTMPFILHLFNQTHGYAVLQSVNGIGFHDVEIE